MMLIEFLGTLQTETKVCSVKLCGQNSSTKERKWFITLPIVLLQTNEREMES